MGKYYKHDESDWTTPGQEVEYRRKLKKRQSKHLADLRRESTPLTSKQLYEGPGVHFTRERTSSDITSYAGMCADLGED